MENTIATYTLSDDLVTDGALNTELLVKRAKQCKNRQACGDVLGVLAKASTNAVLVSGLAKQISMSVEEFNKNFFEMADKHILSVKTFEDEGADVDW